VKEGEVNFRPASYRKTGKQ